MSLPINPFLYDLSPYLPPIENRREFKGLLLDFNEATIPVSKKVQKSLRQLVRQNQFQIYPEYGDLTKKIAQYAHCRPAEVLLTNGSGQAIDLIFRAFTQPESEVIIPSPTFSMFYQWANLTQSRVITPEYDEKGRFPLEKVLSSIGEKTKLVILCNPNNPTGTLIPLTDIEKVLIQAKNFNAMVYVDEAYYEFSKLSCLTYLKDYDNLIVTRTFSKVFGLASFRIGYALAREAVIDQFLKIRAPYDVNMVATVAASSVLDDLDRVEKYRNEVMEVAKPIVEDFLTSRGIHFFHSKANFILFKLPDPETVLNRLEEAGYRFRKRNLEKEIYLRVTIGTASQMKRLTKQLSLII